MTEDKPFIHLMKTPYNYYFYDVNANSIIKIEKKTYEYLYAEQMNLLTDSEREDADVLNKIRGLKNDGFLSSNKVQKIVHSQDRFMDYWLDRKIRKITLQITQQCNFRCSYCTYSESDFTRQRTHSIKRMSFDTAKKAIGIMFEHSMDVDEVDVGFYGGEPLLEFDLIKRCVAYAEDLFEGKILKFNMTTNGSLLYNSEFIEFFQKHKFDIMISFDGPKQIHDRHRRFASDGCGTFEAIDKNLQKIKADYPEFFNSLKFNVVINPQDDYNCLNDFFINYDILKNMHVLSTLIDDTYSEEKLIFSENYIANKRFESFKMFLSHFNRLDKSKVSPVTFQELRAVWEVSRNMVQSGRLPENMAPSGPCIPGAFRLFVTADGELLPCERVSEISDAMKLGSVETGIDLEKARSLLNIAELTAERCRNCWAFYHCTLCAKHADNLDDLSGDLKGTYCKNVRFSTDLKFKDLLAITEIKSIIDSTKRREACHVGL